MAVVGIDIGYQSCYVSVARQGGIETIANEYSDRNTPTYVSFGDRSRAIGTAAKQQAVTNMRNTMVGFSRLLATRIDDKRVERERFFAGCEFQKAADGNVCYRLRLGDSEREFTTVQCLGMTFGKLRSIAETALRTKVTDVVVNVPAYFNESERRAVMSAAQIARLNPVRVLNDTTSVALSYGFYKQDLPSEKDGKPRLVAFVDMGHAATQTSIVAFSSNKLKVLATACDPQLGGRDFDAAMFDHFAADFATRYSMKVSANKKASLRLLAECERLRKQLSGYAQDIPLNIDCFIDDRDVTSKINRATFDQLAAQSGLIDRLMALFQQLLDQANVKAEDLHSVELVGGATRIPCVKTAVRDAFKLKSDPSTTLNADEAVSRGCALQAAIISPTFKAREYSISDAIPYAVSVRYPKTGATNADDLEQIELFRKWAAYPHSKLVTFRRHDPLAPCRLEAFRSDDSQPGGVTRLGSYSIATANVTSIGVNAGDPFEVKVKVRITPNGLLHISAPTVSRDEKVEVRVPLEAPQAPQSDNKSDTQAAKSDRSNQDAATAADGHATHTNPTEGSDVPMATQSDSKKGAEEVKYTTKVETRTRQVELPMTELNQGDVVFLNGTQVRDLADLEAQLEAADVAEKERADAKNAVEEYVYEMRAKLAGDFEPFASDQERDALGELLASTENWLYDEGDCVAKAEYVRKLDELRKIGSPIAHRAREAEDRPGAVEEFSRTLNAIRKIIDSVDNKKQPDYEKYDHIDKEEIEKVRKYCDEKQQWFDKVMNEQTKRKAHEDPTLLAADINGNRKSLDTFCFSILRKPKPAAPAPPADAAKTNTDAKSKTANGNEKMDAQTNGAEGSGQATANPSSPKHKSNAGANANVNPMDID